MFKSVRDLYWWVVWRHIRIAPVHTVSGVQICVGPRSGTLTFEVSFTYWSWNFHPLHQHFKDCVPFFHFDVKPMENLWNLMITLDFPQDVWFEIWKRLGRFSLVYVQKHDSTLRLIKVIIKDLGSHYHSNNWTSMKLHHRTEHKFILWSLCLTFLNRSTKLIL